LTYDRLTIDLDGLTVTVAGRDVPVTYHEFVLLTELARRPNQVLRRDELAHQLGTCGRARDEILHRRITTSVSRLRRKLEAAGCRYISTVNRVGYRFEPFSRSTRV